MQKKLGIIAGGGSIPKMLVQHCREDRPGIFCAGD